MQENVIENIHTHFIMQRHPFICTVWRMFPAVVVVSKISIFAVSISTVRFGVPPKKPGYFVIYIVMLSFWKAHVVPVVLRDTDGFFRWPEARSGVAGRSLEPTVTFKRACASWCSVSASCFFRSRMSCSIDYFKKHCWSERVYGLEWCVGVLQVHHALQPTARPSPGKAKNGNQNKVELFSGSNARPIVTSRVTLGNFPLGSDWCKGVAQNRK